MGLYDNLNRDEAKREMKAWKAKYDRLVERRALAKENMRIASEHMSLLRDRLRVAPAAPKFW